ncbi:hypothetical protein FF38_12224 [Lucilia cuprina]|uniref:PH domain-containing protein n=1 Tax=Lucilia cuprina TaxID=7375 RepID=A0A0L0C1B7_LUCCU|nr:hypothetical protein CVS40_2655 [Lucilia cuprina]KNC26138.1 hypothetical protein FF38_12224 [Lucilia cuprina]
MDLDIIQSTKEGEITQFLCDVRDYFRASLATSEYENTSNMFYLTASDSTEQLLNRCECLLNRLNNQNQKTSINTNTNGKSSFLPLHQQWQSNRDKINVDVKQNKNETEEVSYLDMSASHYNRSTKSPVGKIVDFNSSGDSDKTFRCSTLVVRQNKSFLHRIHDTMTTTTDDETDGEDEDNENHDGNKINQFEDDPQIYDICQVTTQGSDGEEDDIGLEETQKAITPDSHFSLPNIDCPYMDLPAGHLSIKKSTKYGQLLRIEKRLFFDQSKKYYCGILNDWLLCYADGPTSNRPTISLYLKIPSIEIEHFGEGKRRDVCFQITTCDPNKRFVFQAINEIDAKEWIHAVEAAIRSEVSGTEIRNSNARKLPTPPVMKKLTFLNTFQRGNETLSSTSSNDCIYEEPAPAHQYVTSPSSDNDQRPELPHKQSNPIDLANKFEYDVPKCPPQPLNYNSNNDILLINPYENNSNSAQDKSHTLTLPESNFLPTSAPPSLAQKKCSKIEENLDFQAKVKDVHSKLTSQLSSGPNIKKSFKISVLSSSQGDAESLVTSNTIPSSPTSPLPAASDFKKQKKTSTPPNSPQKTPNEKSSFAKNWFLNRLNKTTSSTRSNPSSPSNSPSKCKQSEKENLLNSTSDVCDGYDMSSNPVSPILQSSSPTSGKSKVNMIINQLEASGHLASMFSVDAVASFSSFCDNDCNNYEPIMTISSPPSNFLKKV